MTNAYSTSIPSTTTISTNTIGVLIWNCNFDANTILTQQCGGATSVTGPTLSGPTWGVVANDAATGATPVLVVTDVKSISMF